jgi:tetratricopeptide (TPR) repeat protein
MVNAYLQRASVYSYIKEYKKAVDDLTFVIKKDNKQVFALISRGSAYNKLKEYQKAMADFNAALSIDPENQEAYNNRGWSKKFTGDKKGACKDWKTSKKKGNKEAKIILGNNDC